MKFKTSYASRNVSKYESAVGEWITTQRFPLFGTATYRHPHHIELKRHTEMHHTLQGF